MSHLKVILRDDGLLRSKHVGVRACVGVYQLLN